MTNEEKIQLIGQKILLLSRHLENYKAELADLQRQLDQLRQSQSNPVTPVNPAIQPSTPVQEPAKIVEEVKPLYIEEPAVRPMPQQRPAPQPMRTAKPAVPAQNLEERIGAKLFSIIGIIVLVLGIAIGVKYAIDRDLINETTRLVLGYMAGGILLGLSLFYKRKYETFSAILLSGGMAVMYFTTYAGYAFYHKYPVGLAFFVMAVFTAFTVLAAHVYNYEVIALIGLVGGYALPPLLSTGGGEIQYMFGFMLILNLGILVLSFLKDWRFVNHVAYGLTWLIFAVWMITSYEVERYLGRTMFFSFMFFLIFYGSFLSYKLFKKKALDAWDVVLILSNSMIFFGIGYNALNDDGYSQWQGLFAIANAVIHLLFAVLCKQRETGSKTLFHFIIAMVTGFITMAIPIQLDGNYVTIIWLTEMLILMWLSQRFEVKLYRNMSYAMAALAMISLAEDWISSAPYTRIIPLLSSNYFFTALYATVAFWGLYALNKRQKPDSFGSEPTRHMVSGMLFALALLVTYITFLREINLYFDQHQLTGAGTTPYAVDTYWQKYHILWAMIYTSVFTGAVSLINLLKYKDRTLAYIGWCMNFLCLIAFLTGGLLILKSLRQTGMVFDPSGATMMTVWNYAFHYVVMTFVVLQIVLLYIYRKSNLLPELRDVNYWLFHAAVLVTLSAMLMHLVVITHLQNYEFYQRHVQRLGYTILWGVYSMGLIVYGILRKQKQLRIIAITLFGLTIAKLGLDAISMEQGPRLVVFIIIGVILLTVSFMYQKFRPLLFGESTKTDENTDENTVV